ncbi:MAG: phosphonate ABC transporter, permease protein PhnE [Verrucomicrobiales bacterium]
MKADDPLSSGKKLTAPRIILLGFAVAVVWSLPALEDSRRSINYWDQFVGFLTRFFPPNLEVLPQTLSALVETMQIAIMATFWAALISTPLAFAGARNLSPRWVSTSTRVLMNAIRTVPSLIWAVLAVAVVGAVPLAGVVALTFYSIGYLAKFFSDDLESINLDVARGLRSMGAHRIQAFQHGIWPFVRPLIWSQIFWMLEYNIRSAAIVGFVGVGGVGYLLYLYAEYVQWQNFATVLLVLFVVVLVLDFAGGRLRRTLSPEMGREP